MQGKDRALVAVGGVLGIAALWYAAPRLYDFLKAKAEAEVKKWVKNALLDLTGSVLPTTAEAAKVTKQLPPAVLEKPKPKADRGTTHCKPGRPLPYADSEAYAAKMGGRLLTLEEAKALMGGKPLYPKEDQWCAVQGRDWVQVGDGTGCRCKSGNHHPGKSHIEVYGYPGWGDDANDGNLWHYVALYKTGSEKHCKPGPPLTYADSEAHAAKMGGRLLTLEEAKALMGDKPLYPGEDQWCAVQGRDWVQVGDAIHHPGKSHISECGGYPGWGDNANDCNPWHSVALYTTGGGGASHGIETVTKKVAMPYFKNGAAALTQAIDEEKPPSLACGTYLIKTTFHAAGEQPANWGLACFPSHDGGKRNDESSWVHVHSGDDWPCRWEVQAGQKPGTYRLYTCGHKAGGQRAGWGLSAWHAHGAERSDRSSWVAVHSGDHWPMDWQIVVGKKPNTWRLLTTEHKAGMQAAGWGLSAHKRNDCSSRVAVHAADGSDWPMDWVFERI